MEQNGFWTGGSRVSNLKINIHGRNDHNMIIEKEYPRFEYSSVRLKSEGGSLASKNVRIILEPSAVKPLFESIAWGSKYRQGDVEQAGILIGNYYCDRTICDEVVWADAVMVVPADPSLVSASFETIDITTEAWKKMYEDAAKFQTENLQIIGWYHTHLDNISTRFSGVDRNTQLRAFTYKYSFGVVFNPNQKKWSAFYGPDSRECVGELLFDEELTAKFGKPQITINQVNGDSELREDGLIAHFNENDQLAKDRWATGSVLGIEEEMELSFSQRLEQFFSNVGQLIRKPKRQGDRRNKAQTGPQAPHGPLKRFGASYGLRSVQCLPEGRGSLPRIEIKNIGSAEPTVRCWFYSTLQAGGLIDRTDFQCVVKESAIEEIMRHRQYGSDSLPKDICMWSYVRKNRSGIEVVSSPSEEEANAKVVFINRRTDGERLGIIAAGIRRCSRENIKFAVFVEKGGSKNIVIRVLEL